MNKGEQSGGDSATDTCGMVPGTAGQPAFLLHKPGPIPVPVLIAVPHAGRSYPAPVLEAMRHPDKAMIRLEDRYIDLVGKRVAQATGTRLLVAHAPRAMIDLNRAPEDVDWEMIKGGGTMRARMSAGRRARNGLGLVPRRLSGLGELWRQPLLRSELQQRIRHIHRPYHVTLSRTLEAMRDRWGAALLIDLHSMPPLGPKTGPEPAVDYVLGDRFGASCENRLVSAALHYFASEGMLAAHNRPYAGGYVLDRHGAPPRNISALQIEVCRAAYLDPSLSEPGEGIDGVVTALTALIPRLAELVVNGSRPFAEAAE